VEPLCAIDARTPPTPSRDLFAVLDGLPDPRRSWRRHPLGYVLAVVFTAFTLPGFASLAAAAQWARDPARTREELVGLGAWPHPFDGRVWPPSEPRIRWILTRIDPDALTRACVAWTLAHRDAHHLDEPSRVEADQQGQAMATALRALAMDGKCVRGAKGPDASMPQLMAAVTHQRPMVVAQRQIPDKTSEIRCVSTLLADLQAVGWDLSTTVITMDALHTVRETAREILAAEASYLMTVKANRADLHEQCARLIVDADPARRTRHTETNRGHGRTEERILTALALTPEDGIDFPGAAQVTQVIRYTGGLDGQRLTKEVVYTITSLTPDQADAQTLAMLTRGHWRIEALHHVRDQTFGEDASHARTATLPTTLAVVRNTIIAALRLAGATNIAKARRWAAGTTTERITALFTGTANPDICPL
jgi:predicted transposase YbfD/YdcC